MHLETENEIKKWLSVPQKSKLFVTRKCILTPENETENWPRYRDPTSLTHSPARTSKTRQCRERVLCRYFRITVSNFEFRISKISNFEFSKTQLTTTYQLKSLWLRNVWPYLGQFSKSGGDVWDPSILRDEPSSTMPSSTSQDQQYVRAPRIFA